MEEHLARQFAEKYRDFGTWFSEMTDLTLQMADVEEAKDIRRSLGVMINAIHDGVYERLKGQYPTLFDE